MQSFETSHQNQWQVRARQQALGIEITTSLPDNLKLALCAFAVEEIAIFPSMHARIEPPSINDCAFFLRRASDALFVIDIWHPYYQGGPTEPQLARNCRPFEIINGNLTLELKGTRFEHPLPEALPIERYAAPGAPYSRDY